MFKGYKKTFSAKTDKAISLLLLFPCLSLAEAGSFPTKEILVQAINFFIFFALLIFFLRKPIKLLFHKRKENFVSFEKQMFQAEKEKELELESWKKKLNSLIQQEKDIQGKAEKEGEKFLLFKKQQLEKLRTQLKKEAQFLLDLEAKKSQTDLLKKWRDKVIHLAEKNLEQQAKEPHFQKERIKDFFHQIKSLKSKGESLS